jgi:TfoX/Sxy family transcriptional regulator of competence genes
MIAADWQEPLTSLSLRELRMKKLGLMLGGILMTSLCMAGCIGQKTIHARALAPTEEEAKQQAKAQLDEQASGHKVMTNVKYHTKVVRHADGADVYQVDAAERIK